MGQYRTSGAGIRKSGLRPVDGRRSANLASLIELCRKSANGIQLEKHEYDGALNVQLALRELGQEVSVAIAGSVWKHYSESLMASWISDATIQSLQPKNSVLLLRRQHKLP